jgi:hypothetical protein
MNGLYIIIEKGTGIELKFVLYSSICIY